MPSSFKIRSKYVYEKGKIFVPIVMANVKTHVRRIPVELVIFIRGYNPSSLEPSLILSVYGIRFLTEQPFS